MNLKVKIEQAEELLKSLSDFEKKGLDTSSLKIFIKNVKTFSKIQETKINNETNNLSFENKLEIIKSFLEDRKVFPTIADVIIFANKELSIEFKDQKQSRDTTIKKIIGRIEESPELKELVKSAVKRVRNQNAHSPKKSATKKEIEQAESFAKWAEILGNL